VEEEEEEGEEEGEGEEEEEEEEEGARCVGKQTVVDETLQSFSTAACSFWREE
jgi:hypothetical protein